MNLYIKINLFPPTKWDGKGVTATAIYNNNAISTSIILSIKYSSINSINTIHNVFSINSHFRR